MKIDRWVMMQSQLAVKTTKINWKSYLQNWSGLFKCSSKVLWHNQRNTITMPPIRFKPKYHFSLIELSWCHGVRIFLPKHPYGTSTCHTLRPAFLSPFFGHTNKYAAVQQHSQACTTMLLPDNTIVLKGCSTHLEA